MTTDKILLAESYEAAADYIEQHGWYRGGLCDFKPTPDLTEPGMKQVLRHIDESHPPVCAMGAGYAVGVVERMRDWGVIKSKFSVLNMSDWVDRLEAELNWQCLPTWNDQYARSADEVVDLLRMTALKIRMGNIGDNPREYEFEPMPATEPVVEPAAPTPAPAQDPVPA
jgi:hypothetical protein